MPHKRAKRSVREKERVQKGHDLAPREAGVSSESIPKSMARVLNAAEIQSDYKKRKSEDSGERDSKKRRKADESKATKADMQILPGESLAHFNRRVEDAMRPLVRSAVQAGSALERRARKEMFEKKAHRSNTAAQKKKAEAEHTPSDSDHDHDHNTKAPKPSAKTDFPTLSSSQPKRLNDIAQAPPQFTRLPKTHRGAGADSQKEKKSDGVVSMVQKQMMEEEREKAIKRYRDIKQKKLRESGKLWAEQSDGKAGT